MIDQKYYNRKFIMCATGPSLTEEVVETIKPYKEEFVVFGINDAYRQIDFLEEHYACDTKWWTMWGEDFRKTYPKLSSWTQCKTSAEKYGLNFINGKHAKEFSINPNLIHYGANSGYQALNLAFLMGGRRFLLVGYNMQQVGSQKHFFGNHPPGLNSNSPYGMFVKNYETIQPDIRELVINCTPDSALTAFKKMDLEKALNE